MNNIPVTELDKLPAPVDMMTVDMVHILSASLLAGIAIGLVVYMIIGQLRTEKKEKRNFQIVVPLLFKICLPVARRIEPWIKHESMSKAVERTEGRLIMAGLENDFRPTEYVAMHYVYMIMMSFFGLIFIFLQLTIFIMFGIFLILLGAVYPFLWLRSVIKKRHRSIQRALPNVLDLLTLSVEAGRDFLTALRDILQTREADPLGDELERVFREIQLGKQRRVALRTMGERVRQPDLNTVVETLVQADELGVSIGHILRILGEQMRAKRFAHAEKMANESPVKLLFPLFVFIFPAVIIVMLGPILLKALKTAGGSFL